MGYFNFFFEMALQEELARRKARLGGWASKVLPHLYLGSGRNAQNTEELKKHNITHILNVADDVPNYFPDQFVYKKLNVQDFGTDKGIGRVFQPAFEFVV